MDACWLPIKANLSPLPKCRYLDKLLRILFLLCVCTLLPTLKHPNRLGQIHPRLFAQAWWDVGPSSQARTWTGAVDQVFKNKVSPLRRVPGGNCVDSIRPDVMHVWSLGVGGDMASSTILLLADYLRVYPGRSLQARLDEAYEHFYTWCSSNKCTTSITEFSLKKFKIQTNLSCRVSVSTWGNHGSIDW